MKLRNLVAAALGAANLFSVGLAAADQYTCERGNVCVWDYDLGYYESKYYYYGCYNLHDQYNLHWIDNFQTNGARVWLCYSYNCGSCFQGVIAGYGTFYDLTDINSIKLTP